VWGEHAARLAAQVIDAYVTEQRERARNLEMRVAVPKLEGQSIGMAGTAPSE
jgi:hypothetical protein